MTGWLIAAAAFLIALGFAMEAARARQRLRACRDESRGTAARLALAETALQEGARGAVQRTAGGAVVSIGAVPDEALAAMADSGVHESLSEAMARGEPVREAAGPDALFRAHYATGTPTLLTVPAASEARPRSGEAPDDALSDRLTTLLCGAPHPAWVERDGARIWANAAYAALACHNENPGAPSGTEPLLDANAAARLAEAGEGALRRRVATIVGGERRILDVCADRREGALAALAIDVTAVSQEIASKDRALKSHAAVLDRLATAIAIYGPDRRLAFHNAAFAALWHLPVTFLEQAPPEERVLDRLRAERRLPETADFKAWKREQLKGYETREGFERWWHLPDGQTLRVIANPGSDGGVTYVYENVTEQLALERRYNALSRTQGESIDNLGEGIATFGPDGLLRLANPAFWALTGAEPAEVGAHVRDIAAGRPDAEAHVWQALVGKVTSLTDHRTASEGRLERDDRRVLDYAFRPLPDGATLATFADVTDTVNVARALLERNNALEAAADLKSAFIHHVSYELRSPLTTIIGFAQFLSRDDTGPLSDRQREYADHILTSSEALLDLIDGILDLATIEAGIMELNVETVDVPAAVDQVLGGLKDRVAEAAIGIEIDIAPDAATFEGDPRRVRQVIFNLISNALTHSPNGETITVKSAADGDAVAISVRDRGPGIAPDQNEAVFERFVTAAKMGRRGGVGLGLSLVKDFVELHGGTVAVEPVEGPGALVVVRFPRHALAGEAQDAA